MSIVDRHCAGLASQGVFMNRWIVNALLLGSLVCAAPAGAAGKEEEKAIAAETKAAFVDQAASVRKQMEQGGRYEFVSGPERSRVGARLDEMAAIFEQGDVASLSKAKVADLYTAQEDINAILTKRDGRRVICERVKTVGSHMKTQQCITYAEQERGRRISQDALRNSSRSSYKPEKVK
ncbi:hypothetical protein [Tahibacter soli]|uniref:Uncharacterized protein n=1 Tax=Tahibacter soli TaxID=2983605 RepID=A0A9X4BII5_9GAMM|nr:hypothetical protein [Tahibacter soli]MDC8011159.1 hypothetical protein [Tahibacter soli]